ncbi:alpha/beta hydrolase family protein [Pseudaquabacterium rugosum]|uniref:Alpha/beta hydrolase n=1 Tax=Pseudaquabacterium rugosum TaxID=2984194 RepID=A0ABU9BB13_9BURK
MHRYRIPLALTTLATAAALTLSACGGSDSSLLPSATAADATPAMNRFLPVVREAAPGLPGYTVYRPVDLAAVGGTVPVLLWGNGACKTSNHQYWDVLGAIAARGFVVVAYGAADQVVIKETNTVTPARMQASLDWVKNQATSHAGYAQLDTGKIGVFGTSCGGLEALLAGADSRVKAVGALNTGFFAAGSAGSTSTGGYTVANVLDLKAPTLFVGGGPSDVAYAQTHSNYDAATVPVVLAENPAGGHSGLWAGLRYTFAAVGDTTATGSTVDYTITTQAIETVVRWFDYTLNGVTAQGDHLLGTNCGLCQVSGWTVQSRNF